MDTHPAILFLCQLDSREEARFNIEHYTDAPSGAPKPKPDRLIGRYPNLTLAEVEELLPALQAVNEQGAGIFVTRNQCDGQRSKASVVRIRGIHADMDGISAEQLTTITGILPPSIIVQSSAEDRLQLYWQLAEGEVLTASEAEELNRALVGYGADPAAIDISRLLRLPGFRHMKYRGDGKTPMVTMLEYGGTYTKEQLQSAFLTATSESGAEPNSLDIVLQAAQNPTSHELLAEQIADQVKARYPHHWLGDWKNAPRWNQAPGYPSKSELDQALANHIARTCTATGIADSSLREMVETVFGMSDAGKDAKWVRRTDYRSRTIQNAIWSSQQSPTVQGGLTLESHGDVRNAKAFASSTRGRLIHVTTRGTWLKWHDRWLPCEKQEHIALAKTVCTRMLTAAAEVYSKDQKRGNPLLQEAKASHRLPRIDAMVRLAISEPGMSTTDREIDSDPYLLGVSNGVVNLRTGELLVNRPEMLISRYCNAKFEDDWKCPRWQQFLYQVFEGDTETIDCVQRLLGCTLLGLTEEETLVICYGHGSNGKSVFSNVVHQIMGSYAITAAPSLLTVRRQGDSGPRNDVASLAGARYVSINELQSGDRLDEQVVKMLAGREPISARHLYKEQFEFQPIFTPWLRTNHKPIITGEDDGIWRRLALLKFGRRFTDEEKDPHLEQKLLAERDAILMWMIDGARSYLKLGIQPSPRMRAELRTYRRESDLLGEFLEERTEMGPDLRVKQADLYSRYRLWCDDSGLRPLTKKSFTQRLAERDIVEGKSGGDRYYCGLGLAVAAPCHLSQGGVDRMLTLFDKPSHEKSIEVKGQNSLKSCPTCPPTGTQQEADHAQH